MNYTCDDVVNAFYAETGRIGPSLFRKNAPTGPWIASTPRDSWEDGMGFVVNNMMWERTVTDTENGDEWVDAAPSDTGNVGGGGIVADNCLPNPELLKFGQTLRSMRVQRRNVQTPDFCVEDLRADFAIAKMLDNVMQNLAFVSKWVWENRDQNEYIRLSEHKVTEKASFDIDGTTFNAASPPTSKLINGTLEQIYQYLIQDGANMDGSIGTTDTNQPVFSLFTDAATSRDLIRQDPELRADFRYADPACLIAPLGTARSYDGFKHVWNWIQPRYEIVGGAWVRVPPFLPAVAAGKGYKRDINPAYRYATYADSIVHIPGVYTQRVPKPITNPGGALKFDPVNYMGDFEFLVIKDKKCNPRGTKGFFDAIFASASDPGHTEHGFVIRHLNCPPLRTLKPSCYSI